MYTGDRTKIRILNFFYTHYKFDDGEKYHVLMKLSISDDVYVKEICFVILPYTELLEVSKVTIQGNTYKPDSFLVQYSKSVSSDLVFIAL